MEIKHFDILEQPITVGNYVAVSHNNDLYICRVSKLTPYMVRLERIGKKKYSTFLKYPIDMVVISSEDATIYALKHLGA